MTGMISSHPPVLEPASGPQSNQIFVYGEIGLDNIIRVPFFPTPGKDAEVLSESYEVGGGASNVAVILSNWGLRVGLAGNCLGVDFYGRKMYDFLLNYPNLDLSRLEIRPRMPSPYCRIMVRPDGDRSILFYNTRLLEFVQPLPEMFRGIKIAAIDLNGGDERVEAAALAIRSGCITVVGDVMRLDHPILPYCKVITNSAALIRHQYPEVNLRKHARSLWNVAGSAVITTDGSRPIHVITPEGHEFTVKPPRVDVVDTTGAGDALKSGIIYGLHQQWDWEKIVAWGSASGTANIQRLGAASNPPPLVEVQALAPLVEVQPL